LYLWDSDDVDLLVRTQALLAIHESKHGVLEAAAAFLDLRMLKESLTEVPGTVIGRYRLLEKTGEGGKHSKFGIYLSFT